MKIAIVFDDLVQHGGAEKLLLAVHDLYPNAPVYTSLATKDWLFICADRGIILKTSFMQALPFKKIFNRVYGILGLHILAFESFNFDDFDVVLSISSRFAHGVVTRPATKHICYMNSPGRMFWEPFEYFDKESFLQNEVLRKMFWFFFSPLLSVLRLWDFAAAQRVDYFIANSLTPQGRIKKYYQRGSKVIYPFVDGTDVNLESICNKGYFLVVTRLNAWKRVDIAVEACNALGLQLKVVGEGSDRKRLGRLNRNARGVEFLGYVKEKDKYELLSNCTALIVTQKEDFGIAALEATAFGKPVVAYKQGGALETVVDGVTGKFFDAQNVESLSKALSEFDPSTYRPVDCIQQAAKFSKQRFLQELDEWVKKVYDGESALN
jgi:glycosyltransferase involved in cell wall biosynthesis